LSKIRCISSPASFPPVTAKYRLSKTNMCFFQRYSHLFWFWQDLHSFEWTSKRNLWAILVH
jgi:hypothetical protein